MDYSREQLINICEKAIVPVGKWADRDTPDAQLDLGKVWVLLKANCQFEVLPETDNKMIYLKITYPDFHFFETHGYQEDGIFYLPTEQRLAEVEQGSDWY